VNVVEHILAAGDPRDVAILSETESYTYAELAWLIDCAAARLAELGVGIGDRVGILAQNSPLWVASYFGAMKLGAIAFPLPHRTPEDRAARLLSWADCKALCATTGFVEAHGDSALFRRAVLTERDLLRSSPPALRFAQVDGARTVAALMLTSGSTREPRAVMVSHGNILANTRSIVASLALTRDERALCVLPLSYCFGTSLLHSHLAAGGSVVLSGKLFNPAQVVRNIVAQQCTGFAGVPSVFQVLLRSDVLRGGLLPLGLRKIQQAGGRLAPPFIEELRGAAPHAEVFIMYGQTEATARLACLPPKSPAAKTGSVGMAIPGVTLTVVDEDGKPVAPCIAGGIVAEGDNVALGYWRDPEATARCFRGGRLFTGDRGYFDADGFLYLLGRDQDFIKSGGYRCSVSEIEECALSLPQVVEAAAVAVPDAVRGEAIRLFLVANSAGALSPATVLRHFRTRLPAHLAPHEVVFLDALPKNSSGKVVKPRLRDSAALAAMGAR